MRALALAAVVLLVDATPRGDYFRPESARLVTSYQFAPAGSFAFTRDARKLLVLGTDGRLSLWDLGTRREIRQVGGAFFPVRLPPGPAGARILLPSVDRRSSRLVDLEKGSELRAFTDVYSPHLQTAAISPDGTRVALVRKDRSVGVFNAATGEDLKTITEAASRQGGSMAWSPDGRVLAIHGWDSTVRLFDPASGETLASFGDMGRTPIFLAFSPDSTHLAIVTQEAKLRVFDRAGKEVKSFEEALTGVRQVAFTPDSRLMAAADIGGKVRIWNARTWVRIRDLDAGAVRHLAFSPDGRHLAVAHHDGTIKLWGGTGRPVKGPGGLGIRGEPGEPGAIVKEVIKDSAAERAGIQVGDQIVKVGALDVDSFDALRHAVLSKSEGDVVDIVVKRKGADVKLKVKLGPAPAPE
jgi:WD40 repeat protein